jgi:cytochrome P450
MNRAFTAPTVAAVRPAIERLVDALIDDFDRSSVDLVSAFGAPLPLLVICEMLNIPVHDRREFLVIGDAVGRSVDPDVSFEERLAALERMRGFIAALVGARRQTPGDDLTTRLIEAADDGLVNDDELLANTGVLLVAGFETTTNLVTGAILQLLRHPDQLAELRADPALIRTCVEEVLRYEPPTQYVRPRTIAADVEIAGTALHPGDAVVPLLAAANRDPDEFTDPETFDIRRAVNRHLSFGLGQHLCVGAALARLEAEVAVLRLVQRFPGLALGPDDPVFRPHFQLRGLEKLPVTL